MLGALIFVFCGVLNKLAGLLLGPGDGSRRCEPASASNVAAMSLALGTLALFTAWWPASLRHLLEHASNIIRGLP